MFLGINLAFALFSLGQFVFVVKNQDDGLQGDWLCYGMYYTSVVMVSVVVRRNPGSMLGLLFHILKLTTPSSQYKPFSLNMFWLLTVCIMYAFTDTFYDKSSNKLHQRDSLGTPVSYVLDACNTSGRDANAHFVVHLPPRF